MSENNFYALDFDKRYQITPDSPDDTLYIETGQNVWFDLNDTTNTIKINASNGLASINVNGTEVSGTVLSLVAGDDIILTPDPDEGTITIRADRGRIFDTFNVTDTNVDVPISVNLTPAIDSDTLTLKAGQNVNLIPNSDTNTIEISSEAGEIVSAYGIVVADGIELPAISKEDTIDFIPGDNVTFDVDTSENSITINSTGGGGGSGAGGFETVTVDSNSIEAEDWNNQIHIDSGDNISLDQNENVVTINVPRKWFESVQDINGNAISAYDTNTLYLTSSDDSVHFDLDDTTGEISITATGGGGSGDGVQNISYGDGYVVTPDEDYGSIYLNETGGNLHAVSAEGDPENYLTLHVPSLEGGDGITITGSSGEYWPYWCDETETISVNVGTGLKIENGQIVPDVPVLKQLLGIS